MRAHPQKKKSEIPYIDIRDDNYRVNNYNDTSFDEEYPCTHLSFLSSAARFGNERGDEEFFDDKN